MGFRHSVTPSTHTVPGAAPTAPPAPFGLRPRAGSSRRPYPKQAAQFLLCRATTVAEMGKCRSDSISHCGNCFAPLSPSGHSQCCAGLPSPRPLPRKVHCVTQPRSAQLLSVGLQRQTAEGAASIRPSARQLLSLLSPRQPWHRPAAPPSSSSPLCCLRRPLPTNPQRFQARPTHQCRG